MITINGTGVEWKFSDITPRDIGRYSVLIKLSKGKGFIQKTARWNGVRWSYLNVYMWAQPLEQMQLI